MEDVKTVLHLTPLLVVVFGLGLVCFELHDELVFKQFQLPKSFLKVFLEKNISSKKLIKKMGSFILLSTLIFWKKSLKNSCFSLLQCYAMPPTHFQLMRHPSTCTNEWRPASSTLCPSSLPRRKVQEASCSYIQAEAQKNHPQRIS